MEGIALSKINYGRLLKKSLKVSSLASSQGNIKCLIDLKDFKSIILLSYCTTISTIKKKKKTHKEWVNTFMVDLKWLYFNVLFFHIQNPTPLISHNAVSFSWSSGLGRAATVSSRNMYLDQVASGSRKY